MLTWTTWFTLLTMFDKIFVACAALGGLLFIVRVVLMLIGVDDDTDADGDDALDTDDGDTKAGFKLLSFQSITAFFMMFGLVGLALHKGSSLHPLLALVGAIAAGLMTAWILGILFGMFTKLQHSGTVSLKNAIGQEGTIYLRIQKGGTGKVQVAVQGRMKTLDAISKDKLEIPSDSRVKVTGVANGTTLIVSKV